MLISNGNNGKNINLSSAEVTRLTIWCIILSMLFLLKYIFSDNQFVMTYFKGIYNFLSIIAFLIFVWSVEIFISKNKRPGENGGD